MIFYSCSGV
jgi:hypothetical protein